MTATIVMLDERTSNIIQATCKRMGDGRASSPEARIEQAVQGGTSLVYARTGGESPVRMEDYGRSMRGPTAVELRREGGRWGIVSLTFGRFGEATTRDASEDDAKRFGRAVARRQAVIALNRIAADPTDAESVASNAAVIADVRAYLATTLSLRDDIDSILTVG